MRSPERPRRRHIDPGETGCGGYQPSSRGNRQTLHPQTRAGHTTCPVINSLNLSERSTGDHLPRAFAFSLRHVMKLTTAIFLIAGSTRRGSASPSRTTPAEQWIAAARQQIATDPKSPEGYNNLALAFLRRARRPRRATMIARPRRPSPPASVSRPGIFSLRKAHVALLLEQREFARANEKATELKQQTPDDATVSGYLAQRVYRARGVRRCRVDATQWMLGLQPFNVPGLLIAADLRRHFPAILKAR